MLRCALAGNAAHRLNTLPARRFKSALKAAVCFDVCFVFDINDMLDVCTVATAAPLFRVL